MPPTPRPPGPGQARRPGSEQEVPRADLGPGRAAAAAPAEGIEGVRDARRLRRGKQAIQAKNV